MVIKSRLSGKAENISLHIAVEVTSKGYREILGVSEGMSEDVASWKSFFKHLRARGLENLDLIISDARLGPCGSRALLTPCRL